VRNYLGQVTSLFRRPEEGEVEEMNLDHSFSPRPLEAEPGSTQVEGPSGSVPVHLGVNIQT